MGEALEFLSSYLSEGAEAVEAGAEETAPKLTDTTRSKPVVIDTDNVEQQEQERAPVVQTTPKPKKVSVPDTVKEAATSVNVPNIEDMPMPGGISLVLFVVLFIVFAVQVTGNGKSRLSTLWAAMRGQATLNAGGGTSSDTSAFSFLSGIHLGANGL